MAAAKKTDVLLSRFSALGDVAMTLPVIYDACRANPSRRFILLTRPHPASIFINRPSNLTLHPVDTSLYSGIGGLRRLMRELDEAYDIGVMVDLHDVLRTKVLRLMFGMSGRKVVHVDKGRAARRRLTRPNGKRLISLPPMWQRYADAIRSAGIAAPPKFTSIFANSKPDATLFAEASAPVAPGDEWIAIAPFAHHEGKIYPPALMEKVIDMLAQKPGRKIFIFGFGDKESSQIESWRKERLEIVNMASLRLGIPAELSLLSQCRVMLSMDSANMHLASLVGLRTVSIWGATHPYCGFRPATQRDEDILQLHMTCRPCSVFGQRPCRRGDYHCLHGITPARVVNAVEKALENN